MIMTLKVDLIFGIYASENWRSEIEIHSSCTLHNLHLMIQEVLNFDNSHLYEFYVASTKNSRDRVRFSDDEMTHHKKLNQIFPLKKGENLFYFFDYRDCWLFKVSGRNTLKLPEKNSVYPKVSTESGVRPKQYLKLEEEVA